ncbi:MAG TPA: hypothetical protein VGP36_00605 [Mycobacteriales bacterium]|nr:hypothetical protein [Mycobacteriales bacterium]
MDRVNPENPDYVSGPAGPPYGSPPPRRTGRRLALAGVAAVVLAVGGVAVAQAATSSAPSPSASPSPGSSASPGAPERGPRDRSPFLAGTVVSASGGTITVTDFQGFQRTIHTSSSTTYSDGLTATPAAGTKIVAEGTVDSDKTSLEATKVGKLPDRAEGGPGRGFPGGPRGRHHDGDKDGPSGSATPSPGTPSPSSPSPSPSATS